MATRNARNTTNITPRLVEMTPYQIYLQQVRGVTDGLRAQRQGLSYVPPQLGGLSGQLQVMKEQLLLQLIDFEVRDETND
jgi:hypothetical protein